MGLSLHLEKTFKNNPGETTLEIGCGLAVPSLFLASMGGNVIATDFHPDVPYFLKLNCDENKISVPFVRAGYTDMGELKNKKFSRVMGSDILYEYKHIRDVGDALIRHMEDDGEILLADPGRSYLQEFSDYMKSCGLKEEVIPYKIAPFFNDQEKHRDVFVFRFWR
jgi:predicted nicotinamide N-methyase